MEESLEFESGRWNQLYDTVIPEFCQTNIYGIYGLKWISSW